MVQIKLSPSSFISTAGNISAYRLYEEVLLHFKASAAVTII